MYYYFDGFKVDVFGYDHATNKFFYSVETPFSSKTRTAKEHFKYPDKRNPWIFPFGAYIYIIDPRGKKHRLFLD